MTNKHRRGYTIVEVLVALAITSLTINYYVFFASQTYSTSTYAKNYLQAVTIIENLYQEILISNPTSWTIGGSYTYTFDINGQSTPLVYNYNAWGVPIGINLTGVPFVAVITPETYTLLPSLKNIKCEISWIESGTPKRISFHVLK